jgi:Glycosyltransferase Family 4/Glycosyl transferases group 1
LVSGLACAGVEVDLLCPWGPGEPPWRFWSGGARCYPHFFMGNFLPIVIPATVVPPQVTLSWQPFSLGPRRRLRTVQHYDIVEFHFCAHAYWMERIRGAAKVVYVAHNVEYDYFHTQRVRARMRQRMAARIWALEREALRASDLVLACTERDASRFRSIYGRSSSIEVVPAGFDDGLLGGDDERLREHERERLGVTPEHAVVLFIGGPAPHNREAVALLEREVMPQLPRMFHLVVAGQCGRPGSPQDPRVHHLGYIEDLRPVLAAADVGVNPVGSGSGANHKIAQYLGAGLQVVTTRAGARGYESVADRLDVADVADLAAVIRALDHRQRGQPPPELSWRDIGRRVGSSYERLLRAGQDQPAAACTATASGTRR